MWDKVFAMAYDLGVRKRYGEFRKNARIVGTDGLSASKRKRARPSDSCRAPNFRRQVLVFVRLTNLPGEVRPDARRRGSSLP